MTRSDNKDEMRERILETADRLFYGKGIRAVGVDTVALEIGISKRTLYNYFASKDDLIVAYLSRRLKPWPVSDRPPAEQILGDFERLERTLARGTFRGCPFVNAVAELKEPHHAANKIALQFKDHRRAWFLDLLKRLPVVDPETLATQLMLLVDGAVATALVRGDASVARSAQKAAAVLLAAAGVPTPASGAGAIAASPATRQAPRRGSAAPRSRRDRDAGPRP